MDSEQFDKQWPMLIGVSRRDVAYCIAVTREPEEEHELYDLPDWAIEEATSVSDNDMSRLRNRASDRLYDEATFYDVIAVLYQQLIPKTEPGP